MEHELPTEELKRRLAAARERREDYIRVSKGADDLGTRLKIGRYVVYPAQLQHCFNAANVDDAPGVGRG